MKQYLLISIMLLSVLGVYSQDRENPYFLRVDAGHASTGTGDLPGYGFQAEVGKYFTKHIKAGAGFTYAKSFRNRENELLSNATAAGVDLTLYADLLRIGIFNLELGAGGYYRDWQWIYATGPRLSYYREPLRLGPSSYGTVHEQGVGYTVSVGMN